MAYLPQISGLTGHKTRSELKLKNPYGVLGERQTIIPQAITATPPSAPVAPLLQSSPAKQLPSADPVVINNTPALNALPPADILSLIVPPVGGDEGGGNGPSVGGPPQGTTTAGQDFTANRNALGDISFGAKESGRIAARMVAPAALNSIAQSSVPAAQLTGLGLVASKTISPLPAPISMANIGFMAAARSIANADMADAIDSNNDIGDENAEAALGSLSNTGKSFDAQRGLAENALGPKAFGALSKAAASKHAAETTPYGFLGSRTANAFKTGDFGKPWSSTSLMDNIARETLTSGSTESPDRGGTLSQPQTLGEDNTYSNIGPAVSYDTIAQNQDMADAAANLDQQAQDQGMVDAQNNSVDGGFFSGFDPGGGVSSGDAGMGGFGDSVGSEGE